MCSRSEGTSAKIHLEMSCSNGGGVGGISSMLMCPPGLTAGKKRGPCAACTCCCSLCRAVGCTVLPQTARLTPPGRVAEMTLLPLCGGLDPPTRTNTHTGARRKAEATPSPPHPPPHLLSLLPSLHLLRGRSCTSCADSVTSADLALCHPVQKLFASASE